MESYCTLIILKCIQKTYYLCPLFLGIFLFFFTEFERSNLTLNLWGSNSMNDFGQKKKSGNMGKRCYEFELCCWFDLLEQFDSEGAPINRERLTKTCQCILFKHFVGCIMTALIKCCRVAASQPSSQRYICVTLYYKISLKKNHFSIVISFQLCSVMHFLRKKIIKSN